MRRFLTALLLLIPFLTFAQDEIPPRLRLELDKTEFAVGETITGHAVIEFAPGFHGYQNPPTEDWMIPVAVSGDKVTSVSYPNGILATVAMTESLYYEHATKIPVEFSPFDSEGEQVLTVTFNYQQCDADLCFSPTSGTASATFSVAKAEAPAEQPKEAVEDPAIDELDIEEPEVDDPAEDNPAPTVSAIVEEGTYGANSVHEATLVIEFGEGLHAYQNPPSEDWMIPLSISGENFLQADYPEGVTATAAGTEAQYYQGRIEIPILFTAPEEIGAHTIEIMIDYQQCDEDFCFVPDQIVTSFDIEVVEGEGTVAPVSFVKPAEDEGGFEGFVKRMLETENWLLIIPASLLIGLALCLTPCVFPMIPITVSFFSAQSTKSKGSRVMLGFMYALGIAGTYGAVGGISAAAGGSVGELFTNRWFVFGLAALLIGLALSMFDLYEIRLPGFISKNLKGRSGPVGAIIMGLLMGFAAAPCAGALVVAVAVQVAEIGSIPVGIGMFSAIGMGMGLPFMVLATLSAGSKGFPKSGGWLKTVKAILGFVVLAIAFNYVFQGLGWKSDEVRTMIGWIGVYSGFAAYLFFFDKSDTTKAVQTIKGLAGVGLGAMIGLSIADLNAPMEADPLEWHEYSVEALEVANESGLPILIDARADWCVKCREIEDKIFETPEGHEALQNIYLMKIDWSTGVDAVYKTETEDRFTIKGLPHIIFMKPGGEDEFYVQAIHDIEELKELLIRAGASL